MMLTIAIGLLNLFLIPLGFYKYWLLNNKFSFKQYPLSYAAKTTQKIYLLSMYF
jgi:hypothetical protein